MLLRGAKSRSVNYFSFIPLQVYSDHAEDQQCYGVYLSHYLSSNAFPEGSPTDFAFIGGLNFSIAMLMAPIAVTMSRRYGMKLPMSIGVVFLPLGFICASFAQHIWQLYLSQGVLVGMGIGFIYVPGLPVISQWFLRRRSLANGISAAGSGIGGLFMCFATETMIQHIGISWSLRVTGVIVFSMNLPAVLLIRNRDQYVLPRQRVFDLQLVRRYDVFLVLLWSFISMFGYITLTFSLPDYGKSIGLSNSQASSMSAILSLGIAVGRPLIGIASDVFGRIKVAALLTMVCGLLCFVLWIPARSYPALAWFALLSGAILGIFWAVRSMAAYRDRLLIDSSGNQPSCYRGCWSKRAAVPALHSMDCNHPTNYL